MAASTAPEINIEMSIEPSSFKPGDDVEISLTVVSDGPAPITIYTYSTIFNLALAQQRRNFFCVDRDTNESVDLEQIKGYKRPGFVNFALGGKDDRHFVTLKPDAPVVFKSSFQLSKRAIESSNSPVNLVPGHRYVFGVNNGELVRRWWRGKKEDLLAPLGHRQPWPVSSGASISLDSIEPVEFDIKMD